MTLPDGTVRRLPRGGMAPGHSFVALYPEERGDVHEGFIRVPIALVGTKPFTNRRHQFDRFVGEQLKRWSDWKAQQGWTLCSKPRVTGPFDPPTARPGEEPIDASYGEHKRYIVTARFGRDVPLFMPFDEFAWVKEEAERYGVDLSRRTVDSGEGRTRAQITDARPAHDPLAFAEERRQRLGLRREDFLLGPSEEPL